MRNILKKKITKGILLFLFTFFSVGVWATEWKEYGVGKVYYEIEDYLNDNPCVSVGYIKESVYGEAQLAIYKSGHSDFENSLITKVYGGVNPIYNVPISGTLSLDFGGCDFSNNSYTPSGFDDSGNWDPYGDSGSFVNDTGEGGGGSGPPPCAITSCPVGYYLSPYCRCILEPCDTELKTKINTLANNAIVKTQILALKTSAKTEAFERSTRIDQNPTTSILTSPGLGNSGTSNSVPLSVGDTTIMTLHSHLYNGEKKTYPVHSAQDLYNQNELYKNYKNLKYNMTVSPTHAYILVTEDPYKMTAFINENPEKITVNPVSGGFKKGSIPYKVFKEVYESLLNQGENFISARASALAYFIESFDTGLALYESLINDDGSTDFHNKRTTVIVTPAQAVTATTPAVPESKSYTNNDCP